MNIIIYRYNSICEPDYIRAFQQLGVTVVEDDAEIRDPAITPAKKVEVLTRMILEQKPLFVFSINFFPFVSMLCKKLGTFYVVMSVDCPVVEIFRTQITNACNRVFLFDHQQYASVAEIAPGRVAHLPLGADADRIEKTLIHQLGTDWRRRSSTEKYRYDVSFVGSLYNEKDPYLAIKQKLSDRDRGYFDGMIAAQMLLPGQGLLEEMMTTELADKFKQIDPGFYSSDDCVGDVSAFVAVNHYLSPHVTHLERVDVLNDLAKHYDTHLFTRSETRSLRGVQVHGGVNTLEEMPLVFRQSKINLNLTLRSIQTGLPQRIWDVMASGGFLMTNYQAEIPEYLEIGKHLEAYESRQELLEKVAYYLAHEEEREEIAAAGCEYVRQQGTVLHRAMEMIRVISEEG